MAPPVPPSSRLGPCSGWPRPKGRTWSGSAPAPSSPSGAGWRPAGSRDTAGEGKGNKVAAHGVLSPSGSRMGGPGWREGRGTGGRSPAWVGGGRRGQTGRLWAEEGAGELGPSGGPIILLWKGNNSGFLLIGGLSSALWETLVRPGDNWSQPGQRAGAWGVAENGGFTPRNGQKSGVGLVLCGTGPVGDWCCLGTWPVPPAPAPLPSPDWGPRWVL